MKYITQFSFLIWWSALFWWSQIRKSVCLPWQLSVIHPVLQLKRLMNILKFSFKFRQYFERSIALYAPETWTLWAVDHKHLESLEMWCWRRMEKISWTEHVRIEEVLPRVKEQKNILHEINKRKANWSGHILRRNCLLQRVIEGKINGG